jgi:hypothetical protein
MPFSELTLTLAWVRANGHCECRDHGHGHPGKRCGNLLIWKSHGAADGPGAWQARRKNGTGNGGHDHLHNCELRCTRCTKAGPDEVAAPAEAR